ncbi:vomeronasal 1 receptor ornAnaV1R3191 [Ornithorhynchus anatinus]|uniref:Vomeronasal type-1 receptor n=1 Tax=Ornithorhynchus anatinus TaxID=9258 RepID=A0A6I8PDI0_ORNAN|nr:vomeronasal 1 receptor ornAnaV1R3191 [Ornithorhynchus anatinus]
MDAMEISFGTIMLLQISIGVLMNAFLLLFHTHMVSASHRLSYSDLILAHLALANSLTLLSRGIPDTLYIWGLINFLDDMGCKILIYLYRVSRGLSICTTCLLSIFQAVTISPSTFRWAGFKAKLPQCVILSCLLSWVMNLLIDFYILKYVTGPRNSSSVQIVMDLKYCIKVSAEPETKLAIAVVLPLRDLFFVGLMSVASGYMVFVLHRHHRQVRHLHGPGSSLRVMPEVQAAKRVIALVTLYVLLYGRQAVMLSVIINMKEKSPLLVRVHLLLSFSFSVVSPFLMIHSDRRLSVFWKRDFPVSNTDPS